MIIRTASAVSCFVAVMAAASFANAQTFSPVTTFEIVNSEFVVEQSQQLTCHIDGFTGYVTTGGAAAVIDVSPPNHLENGNSLCDNVGLNNSNWTITPTGGSNVSVSGISATSLLGTCAGTVTGTYVVNTLTIPRQGIPGTIFGFPTTCYIEGEATTANSAISL
jgi:hypothetical protein